MTNNTCALEGKQNVLVDAGAEYNNYCADITRILRGDREEILAARTSAAFFQHGLGHHLGMGCHDTCGGQNRQDPDKLFPNLRLRGIVPANSVVTIETGVYFCEFIIKPYLKDPFHSKFINEEVLNKYWDVGRVRISVASTAIWRRFAQVALGSSESIMTGTFDMIG